MSEAMRISGTSGNVGIGTASPGTTLQVYATGTTTPLSVVTASNTAYAFTTTANQGIGTGVGATQPQMQFSHTTGGNAIYLNFFGYRQTAGTSWTGIAQRIQHTVDITNKGYIDFNPGNSSDGLAFGNGSTEAMRIDSIGRVGIGTVSPTSTQTVGSATSLSFASGAINSSVPDQRWHQIYPGSAYTSTTYIPIASQLLDNGFSGLLHVDGTIGQWNTSQGCAIKFAVCVRDTYTVSGQTWGGTPVGAVDFVIYNNASTYTVYLKITAASFGYYDFKVSGGRNACGIAAWTTNTPTTTGSTTVPSGTITTASVYSILNTTLASGSVGIGTTNPGNLLQVAGTAATISVGGAAGWSNVVQLGNTAYNQLGTVSAYPANRFTILTSGLPGVNDLFNTNGTLYVAAQGLRLTGQRLTWAGPTTSYESAIEIDGGRSVFSAVNNGQIRFYTANSQRAVIDESGRVGIGTASPPSKLWVASSGASTIGAYSSDVSVNIGFVTVSNNGLIQVYADGSASAVGTTPYTLEIQTQGGSLSLGSASSAVVVGSLAGVGNRAVYSTAGGVLTNSSSDQRLKSNVNELIYGLSTVNNLRPVSYNWSNVESLGSQLEIGFIAQEVQKLVPEVVGQNTNGMLSLDYQKLVPVLTNSIQELSAENTALKARLDSLEARLAAAGL